MAIKLDDILDFITNKEEWEDTGQGWQRKKQTLGGLLKGETSYKRTEEPIVENEDVVDIDQYSPMLRKAVEDTEKRTGVKFPKGFVEAIFDQESSRKFEDPQNLRLGVGLTDIAEKDLGDLFQPNTDEQSVFNNMTNYLAKRAIHKTDDGKEIDMTQKPTEWYLQKYVGLYPGETRNINGQEISYDDLGKMFNERLQKYQ